MRKIEEILKRSVRTIVFSDGTMHRVGRNGQHVRSGKTNPRHPKHAGKGYSKIHQGAKECARRVSQGY